MGGFCSCLGGSQESDYDDDEERRLLNGDESFCGQYGALEGNLLDEDGTEARQEAEALQRMVAKTVDNMVDIHEIGDNACGIQAPFAYAGQQERLIRYRALLARIADNEDVVNGIVEVDDAEGPVEMGTVKERAGKCDGRALIGTFADAAAAMR